ncbi:MAG: peptidoglycan-associated lipoprotein Pal [Methylococcales bacterium]|nr:peptidoglycan-associated lipoprotein Pal [Methylococcales bacterium]
MNFRKNLFALVVAALLVSGCSSDDEKDNLTDTAQGADASTMPLNDGSMSGSQFGSETGAGGGYGSGSAANLGPEFSDPNNPLSKQVIYFDLDSAQVKQEYVPVVAAHANYLVGHPAQHVILAGNTDERGSSEYNISLGELRAKSVERMMRAQGVSASQLEVVSYGEEKPVATGHTEAAWRLNRRVEIGYQ